MHLSLFFLENKLLKWSSFTGAFFWKNMIYKNFNFSIGTCYAQVSTGAEVLVDIEQKNIHINWFPGVNFTSVALKKTI